MDAIRIDQWEVICVAKDPHLAPECHTRHLKGVVRNHPMRPAGGEVVTSSIIGRRGSFVVTKNGRLYELGDV